MCNPRSSLFNGLGRIVWGAASERLGRINTFRVLLASQLIVFGILMTERNPWLFAILVCYVLSCFGGGFAIMPSMVIDVYGPKRISRLYGVHPHGLVGRRDSRTSDHSEPQGQLSRSGHRLLVPARHPRVRDRLHLQLSRLRRPVHTAADLARGLRRGAPADAQPGRRDLEGRRVSRRRWGADGFLLLANQACETIKTAGPLAKALPISAIAPHCVSPGRSTNNRKSRFLADCRRCDRVTRCNVRLLSWLTLVGSAGCSDSQGRISWRTGPLRCEMLASER